MRRISLDVNVDAKFDRRPIPLRQVLDEVSEISGISIILDTRVREKAAVAVPAYLMNRVVGVGLEKALYLLTDMADLKYVVVGNAVYVTSPANARRLEKMQKTKEREHNALQKGRQLLAR